jgi:hypothetical protein
MKKTGLDICNAINRQIEELLTMARNGDEEAVFGLFETALTASARLQNLSRLPANSAGKNAVDSFASHVDAWPAMIPAIEEKRPAAIRDALPDSLASKVNVRLRRNPTGAPRKFDAGSRAGFADSTYQSLRIGQSMTTEPGDAESSWWIVAKSLPELSTAKDSLEKWATCGVLFWESQEFHRERFPSKLIADADKEMSGKGISWEAAFRNVLKKWLRGGFAALANGNKPPL